MADGEAASHQGSQPHLQLVRLFRNRARGSGLGKRGRDREEEGGGREGVGLTGLVEQWRRPGPGEAERSKLC